MTPLVHVRIRAWRDDPDPGVSINGHRMRTDCAEPNCGAADLLSAAIRSAPPPPEWRVEVSVRSAAPPGSATGTSASASVALLAALEQLRSGKVDRARLPRAAHRVETEELGQQSGVQDQLAAVHGGVSSIHIERYPHARVTPLALPRTLLQTLERRLSLMYVGRAHCSTEVHETVIRKLRHRDPGIGPLARLRRLAADARLALLQHDLAAFGHVLKENTLAQHELHPRLVGERHQRIIDIARRCGAWGWKVNGAGGDGGSVTVLHQSDGGRKHATLRSIAQADPSFRIIPITLDAAGVWVHEHARISEGTRVTSSCRVSHLETAFG